MKKMVMMLSVWSCCFLFTGCSLETTASSNGGSGTENIMENGLQEMEKQLPAIEPVVVDIRTFLWNNC